MATAKGIEERPAVKATRLEDELEQIVEALSPHIHELEVRLRQHAKSN